MLRKVAMCVLLVVGVVVVTGCAQKLTFDCWSTLTLQSSKMEVETVLGAPNEYKKADRWMYHKPDEQITVNVEFVGDDKVTYSRWVDSEHGVHEIGKAAIEGTELIERDTGSTRINP